MGMLLDLIRRWFGAKDQELQPVPSRPAPPPEPEPGPQSLPTPGSKPVAADAEPIPFPDPGLVPDVPIPTPPTTEAPKPLGLPADLAAPLLGGGKVPTPPARACLDDLRASPDSIPRTPEAKALRSWTDRELVAAGFLTAEQLTAIGQSLASAVEKPQPAPDLTSPAERRAARQAKATRRSEAIAQRRATDIVYLGRSVSAALNDRRSDHEALGRLGLPPLDSPAALAERLAISVPRLRWLAFHAEVAARVHYVGFDVPKKGGGTRRLSAPHRSLALAQRWIFDEIVARLPTEDPAHGFVPGRSIVSNARPHSGRAVVVNLDLEAFFPSIGFYRVRAVFERLGYSPAIATILGLLCTEAPRRPVVLDGATWHVATGPRGLPQGACTSPGLSNQVARRLDRRLLGLATKLGATYTRYADDLTFSGGTDLDPRVGYLITQVRRIAASEGFTINEAKSRVHRQNSAQVVTGLVVNDRPGVARDEVRRLRAILHRARLEGFEAQNRAGHPDFRNWLLGKIAFVSMARPEVGARLLAEYRALDSS